MSGHGEVRAWLRQLGAERIEHPGGTLYAHLCRVHDRLGELGVGGDVPLAGLTHAVYGTDGFDVALLDLGDRAVLRDLVGADAERLVHLYGGCDRRRTWRGLATTGAVVDRFTRQVVTLSPDELRSFVDLSVVNELDVIAQDPTVIDRYGGYLREVFAAWAPVASARVSQEAARLLGR